MGYDVTSGMCCCAIVVIVAGPSKSQASRRRAHASVRVARTRSRHARPPASDTPCTALDHAKSNGANPCVLTARACVRVALAARRYICAACFVMCGGPVRRQQSALVAACDSQQPPSLPSDSLERCWTARDDCAVVFGVAARHAACRFVPCALSYSVCSAGRHPRVPRARDSARVDRVPPGASPAQAGRLAAGAPRRQAPPYGRVRPVPVQGVDIWSVGCIFAEMVKGEVTAAAPHRVCVGTMSALHRLGPTMQYTSAVLCHVRCVFAASGLVRRRF